MRLGKRNFADSWIENWTVPADGKFTPEQRRIYEVVLDVQKTVIAAVRPGVTWNELQALAMQRLKEAGGWDESYTYGIGHFIGMEVHEHGNYTAPLQPGMVIAIEQGAVVDGTRVAFEDDVAKQAAGPSPRGFSRNSGLNGPGGLESCMNTSKWRRGWPLDGSGVRVTAESAVCRDRRPVDPAGGGYVACPDRDRRFHIAIAS